MFKNLKIDYHSTLVVATADCPPLGAVELKFEIEGIVSENWSASFELKDWDGFYFVEFKGDGEVIDSGISF